MMNTYKKKEVFIINREQYRRHINAMRNKISEGRERLHERKEANQKDPFASTYDQKLKKWYLDKDYNYGHEHNWLHIILVVLVCLLVFYAGDGIVSAVHFDSTSYDSQNQSQSAENRISNHQPISVLMMGTDTGALGRTEKRGRTDTMMINTINPQNQSMQLTSIPRDTPAHYNGMLTKINSVYTLGGANNTEQYVQNWLGVPVNYYMLINMGGMQKIIDDVGGITINPTMTFKYGAANVHKGQPVTLNGIQALDYCRMRHQDPRGDYGRQIRQRQVLFLLFNKITKVHNLLLHPALAYSLSDNMQTNLSAHDLMRLALFYRHANRKHISTHLQGQTTNINGQDFEEIPNGEKQSKANQINNDMK